MTVVVAVTFKVDATSVVDVIVSMMTLEIVVVASIWDVTVATVGTVVGANVIMVVDVTVVHGGCVSMQVHDTLTMDSASDSSFDQMEAIEFPMLELLVNVVRLCDVGEVFEVVFEVVLLFEELIALVVEVVFIVVLDSLAAKGT